MMHCDLLVIGSGPSGSSASHSASGSGLKVIMIDMKKEIGVPVCCGEAISDRCLALSGFSSHEDWIIHEIKKYRIFSPSGDSITAPSNGYSIRRDDFDKALADKACSNGATLKKGEVVTFVADGEEDTLGAISYDALTSELLITTIV
jgi:digeranylgeranylglycerophospholipid reductase